MNGTNKICAKIGTNKIFNKPRGDQITHTKVPDTKQNALNCLCPVCPVYNECLKTKEELLFCSRGRAKCEFEKWGCKCVRCPVALEYNLIGLFYCEKGEETK